MLEAFLRRLESRGVASLKENANRNGYEAGVLAERGTTLGPRTLSSKRQRRIVLIGPTPSSYRLPPSRRPYRYTDPSNGNSRWTRFQR